MKNILLRALIGFMLLFSPAQICAQLRPYIQPDSESTESEIGSEDPIQLVDQYGNPLVAQGDDEFNFDITFNNFLVLAALQNEIQRAQQSAVQAWLLQQEEVFLQEINRQLDTDYTNFTDAQRAFFKEFESNYKGLRTHALGIRSDHFENARIVDQAQLKSTSDVYFIRQWENLSTWCGVHNQYTCDVLADMTINGISLGSASDSQLEELQSSVQKLFGSQEYESELIRSWADGMLQIVNDGSLFTDMANKHIGYYNQQSLQDKVFLMIGYLTINNVSAPYTNPYSYLIQDFWNDDILIELSKENAPYVNPLYKLVFDPSFYSAILSGASSSFSYLDIPQLHALRDSILNSHLEDELSLEIIRDFIQLKKELPDAQFERYAELVKLYRDNPFALLQDCDHPLSIANYNKLYNQNVPQVVKDRLEKLGPEYNLQPINTGNVPVANMDYYSVEILQRPDTNNDGVPDSDDVIFKEFRKRFTEFASGSGNLSFECLVSFPDFNNPTSSLRLWWKFEPLDEIFDTQKWNSDNPLSAIFLINAGSYNSVLASFTADQGSIIVSDFTDRDWTISTITSAENDTQPYSGKRQWGLLTNGSGNIEIYTRAVDIARIDNILESMPALPNQECKMDDYYNVADLSWRKLMENLYLWINSNGGTAVIKEPTIVRIQRQLLKTYLEGDGTIIPGLPCGSEPR